MPDVSLLIVFFGITQAVIGLSMIVFAWLSASTQKTAHKSTMAALEDRRNDAKLQHEEAMESLRIERKASQERHTEIMAKWEMMTPKNLPSSEELARTTTEKLKEDLGVGPDDKSRGH